MTFNYFWDSFDFPFGPCETVWRRGGVGLMGRKSRWQIELFFKWIKQHLKVKRFVGRSKNAVMTQLRVAMCMYLLLAYLKFVMRLRWSLHQMLQVLQLNMFERRPLQDLFTTPSLPAPSGSQLSLAWS